MAAPTHSGSSAVRGGRSRLAKLACFQSGLFKFPNLKSQSPRSLGPGSYSLLSPRICPALQIGARASIALRCCVAWLATCFSILKLACCEPLLSSSMSGSTGQSSSSLSSQRFWLSALVSHCVFSYDVPCVVGRDIADQPGASTAFKSTSDSHSHRSISNM